MTREEFDEKYKDRDPRWLEYWNYMDKIRKQDKTNEDLSWEKDGEVDLANHK